MKKSYLTKMFALLLFFICLPALAQTDSVPHLRRNAVYYQLLGASTGVGVNYDRRISSDGKLGVATGFNVGLAWTTTIFFGDDLRTSYTVPLEMNYLVGRKRSRLELGLGVTAGLYHAKTTYPVRIEAAGTNAEGTNTYTIKYVADHQTDFGSLVYANVGYRFTGEKGFVFRVGVTPLIGFAGKAFSPNGASALSRNLYLLPYLSFGYAFK